MNKHRERLIIHGSIVMLAGLIIGLLSSVGILGESFEGWGAAHIPVFITGVWILVMAALFPMLLLPKREASALKWSLLAAGYGAIVASSIEAFTEVRAIQPSGPPTNWIGFIANLFVLGGSALAIVLTLMGCRAALKERRPA